MNSHRRLGVGGLEPIEFGAQLDVDAAQPLEGELILAEGAQQCLALGLLRLDELAQLRTLGTGRCARQ